MQAPKNNSLRPLFGTDGVRGQTNTWPITPKALLNLALATAKLFRTDKPLHRVIIGKDTRLSGYMLEPALTSGFISMGMDVVLLGPLPTAGVSMLTRAMRADLGVMISASHNPYLDNGIKMFNRDGSKLSEQQQQQIETLTSHEIELPKPENIGRAQRLNDALGRYIEFTKQSLASNIRFEDLTVVVDCANGAAYKAAPLILWELGCKVITLNASPNGTNINQQCGAMHPQQMQDAVVQHNAAIGLALDGDADRLVVADERGRIIDGNQIIALLARYLLADVPEAERTLVTTELANQGLSEFCNNLGIKVNRTKVGDRYISQQMRTSNALLGGEPSGHIIIGNKSHCGDGITTALQILAIIKQTTLTLSQLVPCFEPVPSLEKNIAWHKAWDPLTDEHLLALIHKYQSILQPDGRLLIRRSGTEPVIRIRAEAKNSKILKQAITEITASIQQLENN